jgi:hypothetical protein
MTIAYVGKSNLTGLINFATSTVIASHTYTAGNLLVVLWGGGAMTAPVVSDVSGGSNTFTLAKHYGYAGATAVIWYCPSCTGGSYAITVSHDSAEYRYAQVLEFSGCNPTSPLDQTTGHGHTASISFHSNATATLSQADEVAISDFYVLTIQGAFTKGSGWTVPGSDTDYDGLQMFPQYKIVSSTTGVSAAASGDTSTTYSVSLATFKMAASKIPVFMHHLRQQRIS